MPIAVAIIGVAFAAFCVWVGARIVNRRERWAKRTALLLLAVVTLYPLSLGPACLIAKRWDSQLPMIYEPLLWTRRQNTAAGETISWYIRLWIGPPQYMNNRDDG